MRGMPGWNLVDYAIDPNALDGEGGVMGMRSWLSNVGRDGVSLEIGLLACCCRLWLPQITALPASHPHPGHRVQSDSVDQDWAVSVDLLDHTIPVQACYIS